MEHLLKTDPAVFDDVAAGNKTFEIRFDDRGYQVGDTLRLRKTLHPGAAMRAGAPLVFTGDECVRVVTHILRGPLYGLAEGWVILSVTAQQDPIGYFIDVTTNGVSTGRIEQAAEEYKAEPGVFPLFRRPPAPAVPEGWQLVPAEPTSEMLSEGLEDEGCTIKDGKRFAGALYRAMLAAAPQPQDAQP